MTPTWVRLNWPGQKSLPGCGMPESVGDGFQPRLSKFCPGGNSPSFQVSQMVRWLSLFDVIENSRPSASMASHSPPTVAVAQSKPPYVR